MKKQILSEVLERLAKSGKQGFEVSEARLTLFAALEGETLTITRVNKVEITDTVVLATTARGERFVVEADAICAVKLDEDNVSPEHRSSVGFGS